MKDGLEPWCKECRSVERKKNYAKNREKQLAYGKKYNADPKTKEQRKEYREKNKEHLKEYAAGWRKTNRAKKNAEYMHYYLSKLKRTPKWLSENQLIQIKKTYAIAAWMTKEFGEAYHVDHIIPIRGQTVSGLHVPWNLQVILGSKNLSKGNKHG